ncbi:MAG: hypothetical protein KJ795_00505 [Gammaproteobacteria bacterium]|nr:hypothetical protein [Gammaproteobacteria bacterium]MBU1777500.1 hypothetical protein [Gammaproteobacteria bacterium]
MSIQSTFRVHLAAPLGLIDTPFIVTTAYASAAGMLRSEWFLVVPDGKGLLLSQRNSLDLSAFPESRERIDAELLLNEALDQATLRLRRYIREKNDVSALLLLARQTEVKPADHNHFVKLWLRGACCGCLSEIRAKSGCTALTDTLEWVHGLPMLSSGEL